MSKLPIDPIKCSPTQYADCVERMTRLSRQKALRAFERATDPVAARYVRQKVALLRAALASEGVEMPEAGYADVEADADGVAVFPK